MKNNYTIKFFLDLFCFFKSFITLKFLFSVSSHSHNSFSVVSGCELRHFFEVSFKAVFFSARAFLFNFFSCSCLVTFSSSSIFFSKDCSFLAFFSLVLTVKNFFLSFHNLNVSKNSLLRLIPRLSIRE